MRLKSRFRNLQIQREREGRRDLNVNGVRIDSLSPEEIENYRKYEALLSLRAKVAEAERSYVRDWLANPPREMRIPVTRGRDLVYRVPPLSRSEKCRRARGRSRRPALRHA